MVLIKRKKSADPLQPASQAKQDAFQRQGATIASWMQAHYWKLVGFGACVLAIAFGVTAWILRQNLSSKESILAYENAIQILEKNKDDKNSDDTKKQSEEALKAFEKVAKSGSSKTAQLAFFYIGNLALKIDDGDKAIYGYQSYLDKASTTDSLYPLATLGLAYAYEAKQNYAKALEILENLLATNIKLEQDLTLWHITRLAHQLGAMDKVKKASDRLLLEFPSSPLTSQAKALYSAPPKPSSNG